MNAGVLLGKNNPLLKTIRHVAARARHVPSDLVLAEGLKTVAEAVLSGCLIDVALITEHFGATPQEGALLASLRPRSGICRTTDTLFRAVSTTVNPQGILALVRVPVAELAEIPLPDHPLILCAAGVQDPGNMGALVRTAAAAGAAMVCTTSGTVSARNPKAVRASAGAMFRLPVVEHLSPAAFRRYCEQQDIGLYRSEAGAAVDYRKMDLRRAVALIVGNESHGIVEPAWAGVPGIGIPMTKGVESLNVAAAGAVLLFEAARQRARL